MFILKFSDCFILSKLGCFKKDKLAVITDLLMYYVENVQNFNILNQFSLKLSTSICKNYKYSFKTFLTKHKNRYISTTQLSKNIYLMKISYYFFLAYI